MRKPAEEQSRGGPLTGLKVIEFTHMVMGPTVGAILAGLGADVTKVEPMGGDKTRKLKGSGAGYFAMFNRNKRHCKSILKIPKVSTLPSDSSVAPTSWLRIFVRAPWQSWAWT